jgi:hypothetical protein
MLEEVAWFRGGKEGGGRRDKMRGIVENVCVLSLKTL